MKKERGATTAEVFELKKFRQQPYLHPNHPQNSKQLRKNNSEKL